MAAESDSRVPFLKEQQNQEQQSGGKTSKSKAFVVDFGDHSVKQPNLQDAFLSYRKGRQEEIRQAKKMKELEMKSKSDPDVMWGLRMRFLDQIKQYFGVPYAKKYWSPEEPEYNSPLFLDCCGLVRQALRDMEDDFNFKTGPWNQAYQYDTLPNTIEEKDMMPGDLVFISATYYNPKSKKQRHDMVHVEVWLGDGPKTIGARWQRGKVQVFDSYDFVAKSYHSQKYIFKSIDTWLMGICKSYCSQHPWRRSSFDPTTKSVFSLDDADAEEDESEDDEDAGDTDDELIHSFGDERDFKKLLGETNSPVKNTTQSSPSIEQSLKEMTLSEIVEDKENQTVGNAPCDGDSSTNSGSASGSQNTKGAAGSGTSVGPGSSNTSQSSGGGRPVKKGKKSPEGGGGGGGGNPRGMVRLSLAANQHPTFYIGGGNGVSL